MTTAHTPAPLVVGHPQRRVTVPLGCATPEREVTTSARAGAYPVTEGDVSAGAALRHVREGETASITARGQIVARLVPALDEPVLEAEG